MGKGVETVWGSTARRLGKGSWDGMITKRSDCNKKGISVCECPYIPPPRRRRGHYSHPALSHPVQG